MIDMWFATDIYWIYVYLNIYYKYKFGTKPLHTHTHTGIGYSWILLVLLPTCNSKILSNFCLKMYFIELFFERNLFFAMK